MFPGMNARKMQQAMKRMGIQQSEIPATEVIIRTESGEIVITNPSVSKVNMMGQETFQISGTIEERDSASSPSISEDDIATVAGQSGASEDEARKALEESEGDIAAAILKLKGE